MQNFTRDRNRIFMVRTGTGVYIPIMQSPSYCRVTITWRNQLHVQYHLLSRRTQFIGERDSHLDFTLPPLASLMGWTVLSKNINDSLTCVGVFLVFLCFLSGKLANAHFHFIAFYLCIFKILASHLIDLGGWGFFLKPQKNV